MKKNNYILCMENSSFPLQLLLLNKKKIISYYIKEKNDSSYKINIINDVAQFLDLNHLYFKDISYFFCSKGPGSMTRTRIALTFVKAISFVLPIKVCTYCSLYAAAVTAFSQYQGTELKVSKEYTKDLVYQGHYIILDDKSVKQIGTTQLIQGKEQVIIKINNDVIETYPQIEIKYLADYFFRNRNNFVKTIIEENYGDYTIQFPK
jgi:tRNA A37 threonylcarbamoyladenosine modification protein TsaB